MKFIFQKEGRKNCFCLRRGCRGSFSIKGNHKISKSRQKSWAIMARWLSGQGTSFFLLFSSFEENRRQPVVLPECFFQYPIFRFFFITKPFFARIIILYYELLNLITMWDESRLKNTFCEFYIVTRKHDFHAPVNTRQNCEPVRCLIIIL